jgi:hypothetical protein
MAVALDWAAKPADWDRVFAALPRSTLEQSWGYGAAAEVAQGHRARRAIIRGEGGALGVVQVLERPLLGVIQVCEILRGPLWLQGVGEAERQAGYAALRAAYRLRERQLLLWMPELVDAPDSHRVMRALGARPVITGYSSIWLGLRPPLEKLRAGLDGKWRNALRNAEQSKLKVQVNRGGRALDWLLERHDAFRRTRGFRAPSPALIRGYIEATPRTTGLTVVSAVLGGERVAGALFLGHGTTATYYVGWSGPQGRALDAQTLLLWRGIEALREGGVTLLDLGGIDTRRAPGVARFKLGLGGEVFTLSGTWL